ncbi:PilC/PilY family type IV pilus protein [Congregibacter sp.]|nr:PilC/PilY family type IV pilus protein [Congregibacter sp.]MDA8961816.1 PilC/PilY family type IV pilus protein [Congregibacter sp.]
MNSLNKALKKASVACLATLWCTSPVWGDDTEIFFGDIDSASARPNVLFIIDTSGSMSGSVSGTGKDRLDNVKDAMYQLLDELDNVNVGLMRFTNPGGPVLYPVTYIDEEVDAGAIVSVDAPVAAPTDDAQEVVGSSQMFLDGERLEIVEIAGAATSTFEDQVSASDDDARERLSQGRVVATRDRLALRHDRLLGVRFSGSDIPNGATITNAYLRFTGFNDGNSNPVQMRILGEQVDSGGFGAGGSLPSRADTNAFVDWDINVTVAADETIDTPNVASIVQEIVGDGDWDPAGGGEDDIVFIFEAQPGATGEGRRVFFSRDGSSSEAPRLFVEYTTGVGAGAALSRAGLRFDGVDVPRGVTVTEAYITFTAERDFSSAYDLNIGIENSGNTATFTASAGNIAGRSLSTDRVAWSGTMAHSSGDTFQSPDISSLVQQVAARGDWCGGNAMSVVINGASGQLPVVAFEGSASLAPRLIVKYEYDSISPGSSCIRRTVSRTIGASTDDAEETGSSATTTSTDLDFYAGSVVGLRFSDMGIPRNATIYDAYIEFFADARDSGTTNMIIRAEATDNASTYSGTNGTIEDRAYTSTTVPWSESVTWDTNDVKRTPSLGLLIQNNVTNRSGWAPGNAMAFRIDTSTNTDRQAETLDGNPAEAPRLVVDFEDDGSGITSRRTRSVIKELVAQLNHNGWTPVQDTLYEAARYYTGSTVKWGATRGVSGIDNGPFSYARVSSTEALVPGTYSLNRPTGCTESNLDSSNCRNESISGVGSGALYKSPIDDFCQEQSHIIMLTDGAANRPHSAALIPPFMEEFPEGNSQGCLNEATLNANGTTTALSSGEHCVKDLAKFMNETDMRPTLTGRQRITTHTIGFNFSSKWLADVAAAGGGIYKTASNATELVAEIKDIIGEVLKTDSTFVAPVAAVNEFNQLSHLSQVYFAVFRPDEFPRWRGNLKRYTLSDEGGDIVDANGNLAIDPSTGFFIDSARSFWSSSTDGAAVDAGGAAENLPAYGSRNVYTYVSGSTSTNLANSVNAIRSTNAMLNQTMFDVNTMSAAEFTDHLDWIRGKDVDDEDEDGVRNEDRYLFGDPLHSRPIAITYGGTEANPDVEIYFGANSGGIHAVDASDGQETFAFLPEALLPMQNDLRLNLPSTAHPYGLDGTPTPWTNDNGRDGIDPSDALDFVRIFTGMRRGGRNYYGLDVTDRTAPELMWQILGGSVQANGDDFRELGQTWSRPVKTKVILSGDTEPREVLLFSGGYDEAQDEAQIRTADNAGRGMYMVDAVTGRLLWSGGKTGAQSWTESYSAMDYSFPSTMSAVDINQDGLADMWFGADTGGQVWRFDIANGETLANLVTGGVIADLGVAGGANDIASNRRFFSSPSVALVRGPDGPELAIAIGSGFRPSPLSIYATNRMYLLRQQAVFSAPSAYTTLLTTDLYDATANSLATETGTSLETQKALLNESQGWFFDFALPGEKALSSPLIANGRVIFTTYTPGDSGVWCRPAAGTSQAYSVRLEDAVRTEPRPLLTPSIVDQATIIVPPPYVPDPNDPEDPNGPDDPNDPDSACANGNSIVIKLNTEDGPIDDWCNDASFTYWVKEQ